MEKKGMAVGEIAVVAVGIAVIVLIAVWVINGNNEVCSSTLKAAEASNAIMLGQRDAVIKKLMKIASAKEQEAASAKDKLNAAKSELDESNRKLDTIKSVVQ